jgi:Avidin family
VHFYGAFFMQSFVVRLAIVFSVLMLSGSAFAQSIPAPSFWKNQRGSELSIWSLNGGRFEGVFTNRAPGFACQGIPYPVTGQVTPQGFFFVVTFAKCNSFTRWYGRVNGSQMPTKWNLYYIGSDGTPGSLAGSDVFTRVF